ncbi:MAG TPA: 23S rRNA (pseudouridine(1915)-N(3))-methyltransferase RlmH [Gammaproteobacteria bacterium]|nr:23S rRNA (pseudouridine(1915)-N(3))-methyltransferase RlmH [Gammaproteobacteria bacterium]
MHIHLIAVGQRMPKWVQAGYTEYAERMPPECKLHLVEIPAIKRTRNADLARITEQEGQRILDAIPSDCHVITLEINGASWDTLKLSKNMDNWLHGGRDVALLVGGPEGLSAACHQRADQHWSLSALTLPHPLVRIVLAEQVYRAWTVLKNHPYHR